MKKNAFICFLMLALCFTACNTNKVLPEINAQPEILPAEPNSVDASMLTFSTYNSATCGSGNMAGYYELILDNAGWANIMYTDYATHQQIYLCAQPNCLHNSESCTAWLPDADLYTITATDTCLYLINSKAPVCIERMELDGSQKKTLYSFEENTFIGACAYNDTQLVIFPLHEKYVEKQGARFKIKEIVGYSYSILCIDCTTGVATEILQTAPEEDFTNQTHYDLYGLTSDGFVGSIYTVTNTALTQRSIAVFPLDGSAPYAVAGTEDYICSPLVRDDTVYYITGAQLRAYEANSKTTSVIIEDLSVTAPNAEQLDVSYVIPYEKVGDCILLKIPQRLENLDAKSTMLSFAVNCITGEMFEVPFYLDNTQNCQPVQIAAQSGDMLLVQSAVAEKMLAEIDTPVPFYKNNLIRADDFLAGKANFIEIDTLKMQR